jgi:hypothetical protein
MHLLKANLRKEKVLQYTCANHHIEAFIQKWEMMGISTNEVMKTFAYCMTYCCKGDIDSPVASFLLKDYSIDAVAATNIKHTTACRDEFKASQTLFCIDRVTFSQAVEIRPIGVPEVYQLIAPIGFRIRRAKHLMD